MPMAGRPIPNLITILLVVTAAVLVIAVALTLTWMGMRGWALALAATALALVAAWMLLASRALNRQHRDADGRERDAPFRLVLANAPIVVLTVNAQGIITLIDGKGLKALGLGAEQLIGAAVT